MRVIAFVRHGSYVGFDGGLSQHGMNQMGRLARKLRELIPGDQVLIGASPAQRTIDAAQIIAQQFGAPFKVHPELDCDTQSPNHARLIAMIDAYKPCDALVLVTHVPYCVYTPSLYAEQLGKRKAEKMKMVGEAGAAVLDCKTGEITVISQHDIH
jgi:phosphohistidine phosphatase SixA